MKTPLTVLTMLSLSLTMSAALASDNPQCEMIAALTSDYYHHKQSGKSYDEVMQQHRPEFANDEFLRMADLAINLAYALPDEMLESDVKEKVHESCARFQP
ncbi:MAG: hypothetical protein JJU48_09670 [Methylophaga sp.]|nr:hypothetical protein [Methylophaga sp.]